MRRGDLKFCLNSQTILGGRGILEDTLVFGEFSEVCETKVPIEGEVNGHSTKIKPLLMLNAVRTMTGNVDDTDKLIVDLSTTK